MFLLSAAGMTAIAIRAARAQEAAAPVAALPRLPPMAVRSPHDVFLRARRPAWPRGAGESLPELYAEETHVVHPFHPLDDQPITSRDELRAPLHPSRGHASPLPRRTVENVVIHETSDPEVIVAEFEYHGDSADTGERVVIPAVFIMRVREGRIVSSRDYLDHLASARFRGQLGEVLDAVRDRYGA